MGEGEAGRGGEEGREEKGGKRATHEAQGRLSIDLQCQILLNLRIDGMENQHLYRAQKLEGCYSVRNTILTYAHAWGRR